MTTTSTTVHIETPDGTVAAEPLGEGDPPLMLVHGWACRRSHMRRLATDLSANHETLNLDLLGHGDSDAPHVDYRLDRLALGLAAAIEQQLGRPAVVIGHSMGAAVTLELIRMRPALVRAAVLLDCTPIVRDPQVTSMMEHHRVVFAAPEYLDEMEPFVRSLFIPESPPEIVEQVVEDMLACPQHVISSAMHAMADWDGPAALGAARTPLLHISTGAFGTGVELAGLAPDLRLGLAVGTGHFLQMEVPAQVEAMIERFLDIAIPDGATSPPPPSIPTA